jgi:hypothetical protein
MTHDIPRIEDEILVTDDPILAAEASSLKIRRGYYFAVLDRPRMGRPDKESEIIRRTNTIARIKPARVLLFNLEAEAKEGFERRIPKSSLIEINHLSDIDELVTTRQKPKRDLLWGSNNLAIGLLKAKYTKSRLKITEQESPMENTVSKGRHLVVLEDRGDITSVIAANYAFSINATLVVIPTVAEEDVENIMDSFYNVYSEETDEPVAERIESLRGRIRQLAPEIDMSNYECITFITNGLPWGFVYPAIPNTHISIYPDMGLALANAIVAEQENQPAIRVSLLIDPGDPTTSETASVRKYLASRGSYVRCLCDKRAAVYSVSLHVEAFPYDLLLISTHAGEIPGRRLTYHFTDKEGIERKLVIDSAVGFGSEPGSDMVNVTEFMRFFSLNDIRWDDPEKKKKLYIGSAITDFTELMRNDDPELQLLTATEIRRVKGSMSLKMYDHYYIPVFHSIADHNTPIIFNNACSSWREMSGMFLFAGARAYIGALFDVTGLEAKEIALSLFHRHGRRSLPFALWRAQNEVYDTLRHPYVMLGPHFTRLRFERNDKIQYLAGRLKKAILNRRHQSETAEKEDVKRNASEYAKFLEKELESFIEEWHIKLRR